MNFQHSLVSDSLGGIQKLNAEVLKFKQKSVRYIATLKRHALQWLISLDFAQRYAVTERIKIFVSRENSCGFEKQYTDKDFGFFYQRLNRNSERVIFIEHSCEGF